MKITDRISKLVLTRKPAVGARGLKRDIATSCGISYEAVRQWFAGDTGNIKNENLVQLADKYDTTVDWLLSGKGEPPRRGDASIHGKSQVNSGAAEKVMEMIRKHAGKSLDAEAQEKIAAAALTAAGEAQGKVIQADFSGLKAKPEEIVIRQYDVRASMGHGQVPSDYNEVIRNLIIREDVLREKGVTYTSPHSLAMITGWGQSMEGTINDKDPVIVDRGVNEFVGDGIYVITWQEMLYIKRLQIHDAEHFDMISDHEKHKDRVVPIDDVTIHAKVLLIWNARKA
ncbi:MULTISPECIES: XRE family transcriptional regulator [Pseudomonas]|uniref:XRE family transcriptional regulator n=1 Tax=Pseudomonas TaxID=286 RepID=UPI00051CD6CA|nr:MULTISPECIES: XRE family transcriptional regulator [Pseudomonas]KGK25537.1 Cro/Cl family transcriptional regulator [Pseudomonas plecoglossicida]KYC26131.1 Cro/Cl family transcriptional regulator [Pseudomonas sp. ABFPK]